MKIYVDADACPVKKEIERVATRNKIDVFLVSNGGLRPILHPFVSEANHWMVKHHGIFQGYNFFHHLGMDRNMRETYRKSPYFDHTAEFIAKYDDIAFDSDKPKLGLEEFEPMVRRVLKEPKKYEQNRK